MNNQIKINFLENCKASFNEIDNSINIEFINEIKYIPKTGEFFTREFQGNK